MVKDITMLKNSLTTLLTVMLVAGAISLGLIPGETKKGDANTKAGDTLSFSKQVFPVIRRHCLPCHSEDNMNPSELFLDDYAGLVKGGRHGTPIVPGKPDSSLLILKLSSKPPFGDRMPLRARTPVPPDTIELLRKWILQGALNR